jgi:uncharacterized repeat protein (TIGR01451 family)
MKATLRTLVYASLFLAYAHFPSWAYPADSLAPRRQPSLVIDQKMPESIEPGMEFQIDVVVRNTGDALADEVIVTDLLPPEYELLGVAPTPERTTDGLIWRLGRLEAGQQATLRMRMGSKGVSSSVPPRNVVDAAFQSHTSNVCTSQIKRPELTLTVAAPDAVLTGQTIDLRIAMKNNGTGPAHKVTLNAVMPEGLTAKGGSDLVSNIGELKAGESRVVNLRAAVTRAGDLRGSVTLDAQGLVPVQKDVLCHAEENHLNLTATGPTVLHYDFAGLYCLTVINDGTIPIHPVTLTAVLPEGLGFVRATDNGAYDPVTRTLTWNLGEMKAGARRELAWNGVAQAAGDLKAMIRLTAGQQLRQEITWATRGVEDGAIRQTAGTATKTAGE